MNKILIAKRGEIALRVMRSAREMGVKTVAIFSEADRNAPFVKYADEAVCVGPPSSSESYLRVDKILKVCRELNVDGLHPGYGFLSENAEATRKFTEAGIVFIGPSPEAMELMGDKLKAKDTVKSYNIPMVPGTDEAIEDISAAKEIAKGIGFPILIKAAAGGGGKGMRVVENADEFEEQMDRAVSEAVSSFGNGAVFIEKYVGSPRHIEIQIIADTHGNIVYLFERECSIQRRHQKVIEEAPSSVLTQEIREAMGKCAVDVARSCNYVGAGTVEFLLENNKDFYFLEMNTRLQVEHPVTEMVCGLDLVSEMIRIASGETLSLTQDEVSFYGHAIECRINAEHPETFVPSPGRIEGYHAPGGFGVRIDSALYSGYSVPSQYDSIIAKLIVHGRDRNECIMRLKRALDEYVIDGLNTNIPLFQRLVEVKEFISGSYDNHWLEKFINKDTGQKEV